MPKYLINPVMHEADLFQCEFSIDLLDDKIGISLHFEPKNSVFKAEMSPQSSILSFILDAEYSRLKAKEMLVSSKAYNTTPLPYPRRVEELSKARRHSSILTE